MKKIILLFALILSVGSVSAAKVNRYAQFASNGNGNVSWDGYTNTLKVWGSNSNTYTMFSFDAGTLSNYEKIHLTINDATHTRVLFRAGSETVYTWTFASTGTKNSVISEINSDFTAAKIATITEIRIAGNNVSSYTSDSPCSISIDPTDVYLTTADKEFMTITTTMNSESTYETPFAWKNRTSITNKLGTTLTADGDVLSYTASNLIKTNGYVDVTGYERAVLDFDAEAASATLRMIYSNGDDANNVVETKVTSTATKMYETLYNSDFIALKARTSSLKVNSIGFVKDYDATSTTAFNIAASASSSVAYDRTFAVEEKSTVCLPFALTASEVSAAGKFYKLTSVVGGVLHFSEQSTTEAYVPYVFVPKVANPFTNLTNKAIATPTTYATTVDGYTFQGTMAHQTLTSGVYGYNSSSGDFSMTTSDAVTIDAFRAYIKSTSGARSLNCIFEEGGITGISEVKSMKEVNNGKYYNLNGQEVENPTKGLYIVNGKKVILK